jgi:hypothetical protein
VNWGINVGANWINPPGLRDPVLQGRSGRPAIRSRTKSVLAVDDVTQLPAAGGEFARCPTRVGSEVTNSAKINFDLDIFNVTNSATVLGRQYDLRRTGPTGFDQILEVMNPRIFRLGARFNF